MKITYCENWHRSKKTVRRPIEINEAIRRFESQEHFFAVFHDNDIPMSFIEFFSEGALGVGFLNDRLNETHYFTYQIIKNHCEITPNQLFLCRFIEREFDDGVQFRGTSYNTILFSNGQATIQHNVYCEENDLVKKESTQYYTKNKVDMTSLYKNIPKFGEWEELIIDTQVKFLDL
jgi:hypothetical protein